jgi:hypothetical protein
MYVPFAAHHVIRIPSDLMNTAVAALVGLFKKYGRSPFPATVCKGMDVPWSEGDSVRSVIFPLFQHPMQITKRRPLNASRSREGKGTKFLGPLLSAATIRIQKTDEQKEENPFCKSPKAILANRFLFGISPNICCLLRLHFL